MQVVTNENKTPVSGDFKILFLSKNVELKGNQRFSQDFPLKI